MRRGESNLVGGHFEFVAVYETALLQGHPQKEIADPLKIELLPPLPRSYSIDRTTLHNLSMRERSNVTREDVVSLVPPNRYIVLTARTTEETEKNIPLARRQCEDEIDRGSTVLGALLGRGVFGRCIHRGWVASRSGVIVESWARREEPYRLPVTNLLKAVKLVKDRLGSDSDFATRFSLISRFYSKALAEPPSEEVFLFLWTILEIFPMKDTTDIRPIGEFLGHLTGRPASEVKVKLGIGRLFGMRSDLVHNGSLGIDDRELGPIIDKLEDICRTIVQHLIGLPYGGDLDSYLEPGA
jgi:hypothetical protein